jgi:hypothetical protein
MEEKKERKKESKKERKKALSMNTEHSEAYFRIINVMIIILMKECGLCMWQSTAFGSEEDEDSGTELN